MAVKKVNIHEAKTHLSKIVREVEGGEQYLIGKAGKPVALLVPYAQEEKARTPGALKGKIHISDSFDSCDGELIQLFDSSDLDPE